MDFIQDVNWLDVIIFVILIMSIWVGFARGFIHELIASLHWVMAFIGVYYLSSPLMDMLKGYIDPYLENIPLLAIEQKNLAVLILFNIALFLVLLLLSQMLFGFLIKPIRNHLARSINHALGALIGLIKGLIILAIIWTPLRALNMDILLMFQKTSALIPIVDISADLLSPLWGSLSEKLSYILGEDRLSYSSYINLFALF